MNHVRNGWKADVGENKIDQVFQGPARVRGRWLLIVAVQIFVALVTEAVLVALSIGAASRLKGHAELPMQWQLDGTVTRTAPRWMALAFTPALTVLVLTATVAISLLTEPRPGQAWMMIPVTLFVSFTAISAHAFHLWMMNKIMKG